MRCWDAQSASLCHRGAGPALKPVGHRPPPCHLCAVADRRRLPGGAGACLPLQATASACRLRPGSPALGAGPAVPVRSGRIPSSRLGPFRTCDTVDGSCGLGVGGSTDPGFPSRHRSSRSRLRGCPSPCPEITVTGCSSLCLDWEVHSPAVSPRSRYSVQRGRGYGSFPACHRVAPGLGTVESIEQGCYRVGKEKLGTELQAQGVPLKDKTGGHSVSGRLFLGGLLGGGGKRFLSGLEKWLQVEEQKDLQAEGRAWPESWQ